MPYPLSRLIGGPLLRAYGRPRLAGGGRVPLSGPAILASNHLSVIDSAYLPLLLSRPVAFAAKAEYFTARGPAGRARAAYLRSAGQLAIDRDDPRAAVATLDAALGLLRGGQLLGFYPEGTRSPDGRLYRGRPGIGYLALASGAPVIPVAMAGTREMLPPGSRLPRPGRVEVRIGQPVPLGDVSGLPPARARAAVADAVMAAIAELSGQEYVHVYASVRKAQLAAAGPGPSGGGAGPARGLSWRGKAERQAPGAAMPEVRAPRHCRHCLGDCPGDCLLADGQCIHGWNGKRPPEVTWRVLLTRRWWHRALWGR